LNLLIFEFVSGGGYANQKLSASILSEGYGMLRSLISDCKTAGHNVTTLLDSRLKTFNPPNEADHIIAVSSPNEVDEKLTELAGEADAVYVIAPESNQVLDKLVENMENSGGTSLNCTTDAIKRVSNKMAAQETMKKRGLQVPETVLLDINEKIENIKRLAKDFGYPLIFKPLDGVSCSGLSLIKSEGEISGAVKKVTRESMSKQFIVQKFIMGKACSACVISNGDKSKAVTLNQQFVTLASPNDESGYYGGAVPFNHSLEKKALKTAERAVEVVSGLKGYVGVDMILTEKDTVLLEVNPRLTTSYVGLRRVTNFNPAEAIVDATIERKLPKKVQSRGYSFFSKVEFPPRPQTITETYKMEEVISPPFPIEGNKSAYALIATVSTSPKGAESAFYRTKKRLLNFSRGD
jgi:predicted ATP-grasp superfamily ATP-dependent carboligase